MKNARKAFLETMAQSSVLIETYTKGNIIGKEDKGIT